MVFVLCAVSITKIHVVKNSGTYLSIMLIKCDQLLKAEMLLQFEIYIYTAMSKAFIVKQQQEEIQFVQ